MLRNYRLLTALIPYSSHKIVPQNKYLKQIQIYSLTVLETRSLKLKCQQYYAPYEGFRKESFLACSQLVAPWNLRYSMTHSYITSISASIFTGPSSQCALPFSYKDVSHWIQKSSNPVSSHLNLITSAKTLFSNKVTFTGTRNQDLNISFGETQFNLLH